MIDLTRNRAARAARRKRFSRVTRNTEVARQAFRRVAARFGFHGFVMALGLGVVLSAWGHPRNAFQFRDAAADAAFDGQVEGSEVATAHMVAIAPSEPALKPLSRTVAEGDTIKSIAAEYSVSINTILASNNLSDPDMIQPGLELLIPPVEGVVAEVQAGETLGQLAERMGVEPIELAQANALPTEPDMAIPYERLVVPGLEPAERAAAPKRNQPSVAATERANPEPEAASRSDLTYEVQEGDTLAHLSAQFGVSVWTILTANNLGDPDMLQPGTTLKVLPVNGVQHEVQPGESLVDIASYYKVDLGPLIDFNGIGDPDSLQVGSKLTIPGAERVQPGGSLASVAAPAASVSVGQPAAATVAQKPSTSQTVAAAAKPAAQKTLAQAAPKPAAKPQTTTAQAKPKTTTAQAPAQNKLSAAAVAAPVAIPSGAGGGALVGTAMKYLGSAYVFGGTSPGGFDCSGFVWYVHKAMGKPVSRGLWGQMNGGPRISQNQLSPGDTVFFANTYMPGLSHAGIYIGGGRFIHASDAQSGVKISSLGDGYWAPRYLGASRLY